jgi:hypothetical protein
MTHTPSFKKLSCNLSLLTPDPKKEKATQAAEKERQQQARDAVKAI